MNMDGRMADADVAMSGSGLQPGLNMVAEQANDPQAAAAAAAAQTLVAMQTFVQEMQKLRSEIEN